MAAGNWIITDHAKIAILTDMQLATDSFVARLYNSPTGLAESTTTLASGIGNELSNANGYTSGGQTMTGGCSVTEAANVVTIDFTHNPSWTASGGNLTATHCVIVNTTTGDALAFCELEVGGSVTATDGNPLTVTIDANGIQTITFP